MRKQTHDPFPDNRQSPSLYDLYRYSSNLSSRNNTMEYQLLRRATHFVSFVRSIQRYDPLEKDRKNEPWTVSASLEITFAFFLRDTGSENLINLWFLPGAV